MTVRYFCFKLGIVLISYVQGLLRKPTFLPCLCCHYEPMFLPEKEMTKAWRTTYLYKASKAIWSITPDYPNNCVDGMISR